MLTKRTAFGAGLAALVIAAGSSSAMAANELQIDVNALTATASSAGFSTNFTGSITLADDGDSMLAGILINGLNQTVTGTLNEFDGQIDLVNGGVTGGFFEVEVLEADNVTTNTYQASIVGGEGMVNTQAGQGFSIDGLTFAGMFTSNTFAGVDVSDWFDLQPLRGSFLHFAFNPGQGTTDTQADTDIFVVVPLPAGGALAVAGLAGVAGVRRRRL